MSNLQMLDQLQGILFESLVEGAKVELWMNLVIVAALQKRGACDRPPRTMSIGAMNALTLNMRLTF